MGGSRVGSWEKASLIGSKREEKALGRTQGERKGEESQGRTELGNGYQKRGRIYPTTEMAPRGSWGVGRQPMIRKNG